jgi:hypothetical protein
MSSSLIETSADSAWARSLGLKGSLFYRGPSMTPTFQVGDLLYINDSPENLAAGDVIVFQGSPEEGIVVHRITSIQADGVRTRGDNNRLPDADLQMTGKIIGRVEAFKHHNLLNLVKSGRGGLWTARVRWAIGALRRTIGRLSIGPYRLLKKSGLTPRIWKPAIVRLGLENEQGSLIKYIYKHKAVATWEPERAKFKCLKPFDLVLFPPDQDDLDRVDN